MNEERKHKLADSELPKGFPNHINSKIKWLEAPYAVGYSEDENFEDWQRRVGIILEDNIVLFPIKSKRQLLAMLLKENGIAGAYGNDPESFYIEAETLSRLFLYLGHPEEAAITLENKEMILKNIIKS